MPAAPSSQAASGTGASGRTLLVACGDSDPEVEFQVIEAIDFAESLDIDLSTMNVMANGIYYEDLEVGEGTQAAFGDTAAVNYVLWLADGRQVDEGTIAGTQTDPFILGAGQVIPGFDGGIIGMQVGGVRRIIVPPALAYGAQSSGVVPAGSILIFRIQLNLLK